MAAPSPKDLELVRDAVARHHEFVYRVAYRFLRNSTDAEDVTQAVFLRLLQSAEPYARADHPRAWLARTAIHRSMDWRRAEERRRQRESVWASQSTERKKGAEEPMNLQEVEEAISSLPDELRVPVVLHYREGLKYREIAEVCECPEGTIARRISLAKTRLRRRLQVGGAAGAAVSVDSALRACEEVAAPRALADRVLSAVETRFGELSGGAPPVPPVEAGASAARDRAAARGLLAGTGSSAAVALAIAVVLLPVGWIALQRAAGAHRGAAGLALRIEAPAAPEAPRDRPLADAAPLPAGAARALLPGGDGADPAVKDAGPGEKASAEPAKPPLVFGWVHDARGRPLEGVKVDLLAASAACSSCHEVGAREGGATTDALGYYEIAAVRNAGQSGGAGMAVSFEKIFIESATGTLGGGTAGSGGGRAPGASPPVYKEPADLTFTSDVVRTTAELKAAEVRVAQLDRAMSEYSRVRQLKEAADSERLVQRNVSVQKEDVQAADLAIHTKLLYTSLVGQAAMVSPCPLSGKPGGPMELRIVAEAPGFEADSSGTVQLVDGESRQVDLVLRRALPLEGIVLDASGAPVPGAAIAVIGHSMAPGHSPGAPLPAGARAATADEAGRFAFESLPLGAYAMRATAPGHPPTESVGRTGGPAAVIRFPLTGSIAVEVGHETDGPARGYVVEACRGSWLAAEGVTDESGRARIEGLYPGEYLVNTFSQSSNSRQSRARGKVTVAGGQEAGLRLDVAKKVRVEGVVVPEILPAEGEGVSVRAVPLRPEPGIAGQPKRTAVAAGGAFAFDGLAPGKYAIFLEAARGEGPARVLASLVHEVVAGSPSPPLRLEADGGPPGVFAITVEDGAGRPVPGAVARASWAGTDEVQGQADAAEGRGHIELPAGKFDIEAFAPGLDRVQAEGVSLASGEEKQVRLVLGAAAPPEPALDLSTIAGGVEALTLIEAVRLGTFLELLAASGGPGIEGSAEAAASGALEHATVQGSGPPAEILEAALEPAGLRAVLRQGGAMLVPR